MKKKIFFIAASVFFATLFSCKSTDKIAEAENVEQPVTQNGVKTYVNTGVNNATGNISTILVFNSVSEVTAIHPKTRERFAISEKNYSYDAATTQLKIALPNDVPYKLAELSYHIVGFAADPGIFVLSGIDAKRDEVGVFIKGKKAAEGSDYIYDKKTRRITSLVPLNVDADSFQICWATKNGSVNFSNKTGEHKDEYQKLYSQWARSVGLEN